MILAQWGVCSNWGPGCTVVSGSIKASVVYVVALTLWQPHPKRTQLYAQVKGTPSFFPIILFHMSIPKLEVSSKFLVNIGCS